MAKQQWWELGFPESKNQDTDTMDNYLHMPDTKQNLTTFRKHTLSEFIKHV